VCGDFFLEFRGKIERENFRLMIGPCIIARDAALFMPT